MLFIILLIYSVVDEVMLLRRWNVWFSVFLVWKVVEASRKMLKKRLWIHKDVKKTSTKL